MEKASLPHKTFSFDNMLVDHKMREYIEQYVKISLHYKLNMWSFIYDIGMENLAFLPSRIFG